MRIQTRGGGKGGLSHRDPTLRITSTGFSEADMADADAVGFTGTPERLKHLSAHPETDPQSPDPRLSQSFPCGQQSTCMAESDVCGEAARVMPPATGSTATESAATATKMARRVLIAWFQEYKRALSRSSNRIVNLRLPYRIRSTRLVLDSSPGSDATVAFEVGKPVQIRHGRATVNRLVPKARSPKVRPSFNDALKRDA
jgi:hypothetical protein